MAVYHTNSDLAGTPQAMTTTYKTLVTLTAATATLTSGKIIDVMFGTSGTPADNYLEYDISRQTAAGTITAATPTALDPTTRACGTVAGANATAEGTVTAASSVFNIAVNQRASYRWVAVPGSELIIPNVNLSGFAVRAKSAAYTGTAVAAVYHTE
jgi:hypothetical protein